MNISSLSDQLHTLLSEINISFDVIGIRIDIDINGYNLEHTPTEASCGGTLPYVKNKLIYIGQKDLSIYKKNELEFTFTEILLQARTLLLDSYTDTCACIHENSTI